MSSDRSALYTLIEASPWFAGLPEAALDKLAARVTVKKYKPGQFLYMLGEAPAHVFCVMEGSVRVSLNSTNGQQFVLALLYQGYWFGESSIFGHKSRVLEVWAESETEILLLPATAVKAISTEYPAVFENLLKEHLARTQLVYELLAGMLFYPLKSRLAGRLLFLLKEHGVPHENGIALNIKMSQMDFARMCMGSRQRVNKAFREWVSEGVIEKQRSQYIIRDVAALEATLELEKF